MKRRMCIILVLCMMLSGCSWAGGSYVSVMPHQEQRTNTQTAMIAAGNSWELVDALTGMINEGRESAAINVSEYPTHLIETGMESAVRNAMEYNPIGAYAVEDIQYEVGTSGGQPALSVKIKYLHSRMDIRRIHHMKTMEEAQPIIAQALQDCDAEVVMLAETYEDRDFVQMVQDYAMANPHLVMETPAVSAKTFGKGPRKVVEVSFTYQTPRDTLRQMRDQVKPVFDAAYLYVSGDSSSLQKYNQLYAFLTARFDYRIEPSITPTYSLLRNGYGDSMAFATVYAAMCRTAGLECLVVIGTCNEEPRAWNMVLDDLHYYHVDLLQCNELGQYTQKTDAQMNGYVWDKEAYPACTAAVNDPVEGTEEPSENEE